MLMPRAEQKAKQRKILVVLSSQVPENKSHVFVLILCLCLCRSRCEPGFSVHDMYIKIHCGIYANVYVFLIVVFKTIIYLWKHIHTLSHRERVIQSRNAQFGYIYSQVLGNPCETQYNTACMYVYGAMFRHNMLNILIKAQWEEVIIHTACFCLLGCVICIWPNCIIH